MKRKLTKRELQRLKAAHNKAFEAEKKLSEQVEKLQNTIIEITGIEGNVDYLSGDGFGFTPTENNDTHIGLDELISLAEEGKIIDLEIILSNLFL